MNYTLNGKLLTTGGPLVPTAVVNTGFSATGYKSAYVPFTAEQILVPQYETITTTASVNYDFSNYMITADFPSGTETAVFSAEIYSYATTEPNTGVFYKMDPWAELGIWSADRTATTGFDMYLYFSEPNIYTGTAVYYIYDVSFSWATTNPGDMSASYKELTGYEHPYPDYPVTATGYVQDTIELKEYFTAGNVKFSGNDQKIISYDSSPSDSTANTTPTANVTSFVNNGLKNWYTLDTAATDDNYTYSYGTVTSGYSGYTGI